MKFLKSFLALFFLIVIFFFSCSEDIESNTTSDNFDRNAMLKDWAELIIIPSLESYNVALDELVSAKNVFYTEQNEINFIALRSTYISAYKKWQHVSMFDIGKAEEIGLRNYTNIYPTDIDQIKLNVDNQNYNLELPSNFDAQGFPALDYLLFGLNEDSTVITIMLSNENHLNYLSDLIDRLSSLTNQVLNDWIINYKEIFINNDGASGTASVDKLVNDFLFYYERYLRAGKIGIPAGVFSGNPIANSVEAPYSNIYSKELFTESLIAVQNFFQGRSYNGTEVGQSLVSYMTYLEQQNELTNPASEILIYWSNTQKIINDILPSFQEQVNSDNNKMLSAYDELQKAVVLLKVDMMQVLNIQVDYVDADGD